MVEFSHFETWRWADYPELESTNDEALRLSSALSDKDKIVITTRRQTKGRGRRGRSWIGQKGNLFMSLLLHWPQAESGALVFIVSLALLRAVRQFLPQTDVCLKWPNDVLVEGKKVSGILLETAASGMMVAGIGVNIEAAPESREILYAVTSLRKAGANCSRIDFLKAFLVKFNEVCGIYKNSGMAALAEIWQSQAKGIGGPITVHMPKTEEKGIFKGIDGNGLLLLESSSGSIKTISAGDVFFDEEEKKEEEKR